jgi:hypothetical protein
MDLYTVWGDGIVASWQLLESIQQMIYQPDTTERHLLLEASRRLCLDEITCNSYKARNFYKAGRCFLPPLPTGGE